MNEIAPVGQVSLLTSDPVAVSLNSPPAVSLAGEGGSFADVFASGVQAMEAKLQAADTLVRQFALGDEIPLHQVTFALSQAQLSVELAMQVRARLVEGYREIMNMQL